MAENYTVNYQINANVTSALEAFNQFRQATEQMESLSKRFSTITGRFNRAFNSIQSKPITIKIDTVSAEQSLKGIVAQLEAIKSLSATALSGSGAGMGKSTKTPKNTASNAVNNLKSLNKKLSSTQEAINKINKRYIHPKASVNNAITELEKLEGVINRINGKKVTVTGSSSSTGSSAGSKNNVAKPKKVASKAGASKYLYPTTRQVLGPTYANTGTNIAGEMIKGMGVAYGLSSLMTGINNVFGDATNYDNITQTTRNILGSHDTKPFFNGRFNQMNQLMRQVGVETKFTAPEVAEAGKFLAMAGFNVDQIKSSIRPITDLALIGDTNLGETADVVTNIMTSYDIPAQKMRHVADILTNTFTSSNTTLLELAESFKYAGTMAKETGVDFETAAAAFGTLGDAGIKGSHAGTTFRTMLTNMVKPTKEARKAWKKMGVNIQDKSGNMRNVGDIFADIDQKRQKMSPTKYTNLIATMFRMTATPGILAMISHVGKLKNVESDNWDVDGVSERLADAKKNTIQGLWSQMTSAFTESGMQGFEALQGAIRDFLQRMITVMKSPNFVSGLQSAMETFLDMANAISDVFQNIVGIWSHIPDILKTGVVYFAEWQLYSSMISGTIQSVMSSFLVIRGIFKGEWFEKALRLLSFKWAWGRIPYFRKSAAVEAVETAAGATAETGAVAGKGALTLSSFILSQAGGITIAAGALAALAYKIWEINSSINEGVEINKAWGESMRNMGISALDFSNNDSYAIGKIRIFGNELLNEQEKLRLSTKLFHEYWAAKNYKQPDEDNSSPYRETDAAKKNKLYQVADEQINRWFGYGTEKTSLNLLKQLGGHVDTDYNPNYRNLTKHTLMLPGYNWRLATNSVTGEVQWSSSDLAKLALYQMGADQNSAQKLAMETAAKQQMFSVSSAKDARSTLASLRKHYLPQVNHTYDNLTDDQWNNMTEAQIKSSIFYVNALAPQLDSVVQAWSPFVKMLSKYDKGETVEFKNVQKIIAEYSDIYDQILDPKHGLFGSNKWVAYWKKVATNPSICRFDNVAEVAQMIIESFDQVLGLYDSVKAYKPLFAPFINRDVWESILPSGYSLGDGGSTSGEKIGDTMTANGKTYTWKITPPYNVPQWIDKNNKIYAPSSSKDTGKSKTWTPSSNKAVEAAHSGADQSKYKSHYNNIGAAPKQVIVRIENLMRVDNQNIDMNDGRQVAAVNTIKQELATALLDVVQDFNANIMSLISYSSSGLTRLGFNAAVAFVKNKVKRSRDEKLVFYSPRGYSNVYVYVAKRTLMQTTYATLNDLYPKYVRNLDRKKAKAAYDANQGSLKQTIIVNGEAADENSNSKSGVTLKYKDKVANEGLLLWIDDKSGTEKTFEIQTYWDKVKGLSGETYEDSNTQIKVAGDTVFADLGATVQTQSSKNLILTKVQGRDYSRKELISGGDVNFTVTGKIVSNYPDVYPYSDVSKFITLMQHKGILRVANLMFQQYNVTQILIKDFQMGQNEGFKNVQPYSFTCVAVEPNNEVTVIEDTLNATNLQISKSAKKGWSKVLLEQVKSAAANEAAKMVESLIASKI